MRVRWTLVLLILLVIPIVNAKKVDDNVISALDNEEEVVVDVILDEDSNVDEDVLDDLRLKRSSGRDVDFELKHVYKSTKGFSGKITRSGLEKLKKNPSVD